MLISSYSENVAAKDNKGPAVVGSVISIAAFKNKFWEAYACFGRENKAARMQAQGHVDELQSSKKKVIGRKPRNYYYRPSKISLGG